MPLYLDLPKLLTYAFGEESSPARGIHGPAYWRTIDFKWGFGGRSRHRSLVGVCLSIRGKARVVGCQCLLLASVFYLWLFSQRIGVISCLLQSICVDDREHRQGISWGIHHQEACRSPLRGGRVDGIIYNVRQRHYTSYVCFYVEGDEGILCCFLIYVVSANGVRRAYRIVFVSPVVENFTLVLRE